MPRLGRAFFTAAMILVDYDAGTFTIFRADPDAGDSQDVVPVLSAKNRQICEAEGKGKGVSGSTIAGIVIGALAAIALLGLLFLFLRRRRRSNEAQSPRQQIHSTDSAERLAELSASEKRSHPKNFMELEGSGDAYVEMNARRSISELGGKERKKSLGVVRKPNGGVPRDSQGREAAEVYEMPAGEWTQETTPTIVSQGSPRIGRKGVEEK